MTWTARPEWVDPVEFHTCVRRLLAPLPASPCPGRGSGQILGTQPTRLSPTHIPHNRLPLGQSLGPQWEMERPGRALRGARALRQGILGPGVLECPLEGRCVGSNWAHPLVPQDSSLLERGGVQAGPSEMQGPGLGLLLPWSESAGQSWGNKPGSQFCYFQVGSDVSPKALWPSACPGVDLFSL